MSFSKGFRISADTVIAFLLCLALGRLVGDIATPPGSNGAGVTPFTIDQLEERYGPASSAPDIDRVTYARRSDGSVAHSYCFDCARDGSGKPTVEYVDAINLITSVRVRPYQKPLTIDKSVGCEEFWLAAI